MNSHDPDCSPKFHTAKHSLGYPGCCLVLVIVCSGCAGVPSSTPDVWSEASHRLRPAVIQEDYKTRLRMPGRSAKVAAPPSSLAVVQVSWDEPAEGDEVASEVSSRRVVRSRTLEPEPVPTEPSRAKQAGDEQHEPALAKLARYLWQPATPEAPRELPLNNASGARRGTTNGEESPIVFRSISQIGTRISPPDIDQGAGEGPHFPEDFAAKYFSQHEPFYYRSEGFRPWSAYAALPITQAFCHRPLYFEEINVERFGRSAGIFQPAVSGARFFATVPTLPYRMAMDHPAVCQVDPSPFPPGHPAPRHRQAPPLRIRAALIQAVAVVGIIAIFP